MCETWRKIIVEWESWHVKHCHSRRGSLCDKEVQSAHTSHFTRVCASSYPLLGWLLMLDVSAERCNVACVSCLKLLVSFYDLIFTCDSCGLQRATRKAEKIHTHTKCWGDEEASEIGEKLFLLVDRIFFIDESIFSLTKKNCSRWNFFLPIFFSLSWETFLSKYISFTNFWELVRKAKHFWLAINATAQSTKVIWNGLRWRMGQICSAMGRMTSNDGNRPQQMRRSDGNKSRGLSRQNS